MTERPRRAAAGARKVFDPSAEDAISNTKARTKSTVKASATSSSSSLSTPSRERPTKKKKSKPSSKRAAEEKTNEEEAKRDDDVDESKQGDDQEEEDDVGVEEDVSSKDDTSDESWSGEESEEEEESSESEDSEWSEEAEKKNKRRGKAAAASKGGRGGRMMESQTLKRQRMAAARANSATMAHMYPPVKRFAEILHSNYGFDFILQSPMGAPTVDVTIGNFVNALEGSCETFGNAASSTWLNESPPPNITSGTIIIRPVSMRLPAITGRWMSGHLISKLGCCGAMYWHTDLVGPDAFSAASLIREFAHSGMEIIEHNETEHLKNKGLRLIGRYSWDYYRQYGGGGYRIPQLASSLFAGPHCFFAPADEYKSRVYPEVLMRVTEFDNGQNVRFQPFLNRINHSGALAVFPGQEYMFAKVFLQRDAHNTGWLGVRAMLVYTYNIGETWSDCQIEHVRIPA